MTDDPKKKKADGKRIALTQPHEMAYIRKIAREVLKSKIVEGICYHKAKARKIQGFKNHVSPIKIKRLAKAFLKLSKRKRKIS